MRHRVPIIAVTTLAIGAAAVLVNLTGSKPAGAIADGTRVAEGSYRFSTQLAMTNIPRPDGTKYNSYCSGALISKQWIITAGHCFHDVNRNRVSGTVPYSTIATIGRADLASTTGHRVRVVLVRQSTRNDIALAKLATPVTDIAPLALNTTVPKTGLLLRMTGWGATSATATTPTTHLMTGLFKVTIGTSTVVRVRGYQPAADTSACPWDSGAPYFGMFSGKYAVVGIESTGPDCPHATDETTSRVDAVVSWIRTTIA